MAQTSRSNISPFPSPRSVPAKADGVVHGPGSTRENGLHGLEADPAYATRPQSGPVFLIDEPDPLLISESQSSEFIPEPFLPSRNLKLVSNDNPSKTTYLRIKDLHPMDLLIAIGLIAVAVWL
ncbi:hypothetical protein [Pseudosulfitobacter pseudonitzschiae]|uniref:hypothetical protein n=1 Tax=Pseudosulfitobacter pseudonitzschiae TaxID=1402135 RepID=UPI003B7C0DDA